MLTLVDIEEICTSDPGISKIFITDPMNVDEANLNPVSVNPGEVSPIPLFPAEIYEIRYRKYSAQLKTKSATGPGGDYEELELTFLLPKRRPSVEHLKRHVINRHVAVFAFNAVGDQITLPWAKVSWVFDSGKKLGDDEAYEIKVTGVSLLNDFVALPLNENPVGEDTPIPGETATVAISPIGNGGVSLSAECCVTINLQQLSYVPGMFGNVNIKNQIVKGSDGYTYFIDHQGTALKIHNEVEKVRYVPPTHTGPEFILPSGWAVADPSKDLLVIRNGKVQKYVDDGLVDIDQYIGNEYGGSIAINPSWPLESGEYLDVIRIN